MSRARYSRNWRGMAWIGGCLIFGAVAALRAYAETVLVVYSGGNKEVRQFSVANGVWTYEKVFASGSYEGKAMTPAGVASDGRRVYIGDIAARRILAFEADGTFVGTVTNFASTCMPDCVFAAPNGYLYMSDAFGSAGDRIYRFDLDTWQGGEFIATTGWGETFNNPRGLAVDENGLLLVADRNSNKVRRFNATDGAYSNILATVSLPNGLPTTSSRGALCVPLSKGRWVIWLRSNPTARSYSGIRTTRQLPESESSRSAKMCITLATTITKSFGSARTAHVRSRWMRSRMSASRCI